MPTRITVTRSPTHGRSDDEKDVGNTVPIVMSSDEIPFKPSNEVSNRDDDCGVAPGNEKEETKETDRENEEPTPSTAQTFVSTAANTATTETATEETTTETDTTKAFAKSSETTSGSNEPAKNTSELAEEKKEESLTEEAGKEEDANMNDAMSAFKKVRSFLCLNEPSYIACCSEEHLIVIVIKK